MAKQKIMANIWLKVLIFPGMAAARTVPPVSTSRRRKPVTANSTNDNGCNQAGTIFNSIIMIKADMTNNLSAIGSANLPKLLTTFHFRAKKAI